MKALIFAAGLGTRLKPLTDSMPKALVPIGGKTLLEWQIEKLKNAGITDIIINVHHFPDQIIDFVRNHNNFGCNIAISDEREMVLETGGGLRKILDEHETDGPVLAMNVDILSNIDIPTLLAAYDTNELGLLVVSERHTQRYLSFDREQRLTGWTNISTGDVRGRADGKLLAFSGMSLLSPRIREYTEQVAEIKGDKFSLIDLYLHIVENRKFSGRQADVEPMADNYRGAENAILRAFIPQNYKMMDVGKINQLAEAEQFARSL